MFNQKASDQDRHQTLQALIKKDYAQQPGEERPYNDRDEDASENSDPEHTEEVEFYNDEQLNEIMARDDKEYDLFTQIDAVRNEEEDISQRKEWI